MRATELINTDQLLEAVQLFEKYGTSTNPQNFNIYKKLIDSVSTLLAIRKLFAHLSLLTRVKPLMRCTRRCAT